jgi:glycine/serine hydroxymethyltransferase
LREDDLDARVDKRENPSYNESRSEGMTEKAKGLCSKSLADKYAENGSQQRIFHGCEQVVGIPRAKQETGEERQEGCRNWT